MTVVAPLVTQVLHTLLILVAAAVLPGLLAWLVDRLGGRRGMAAMQQSLDLAKLMRKQPVLAENASHVTRAVPLLLVSIAFTCAVLVPSFSLGMILSPMADFLTIAALLALSRMVMILAAMDAGTGEGGVSALYAVRFGLWAEPALLLAIFGLALMDGCDNLDLMIGVQQDGAVQPGSASALVLCAMAMVAFGDIAQERLDQAFSARDLALVRIAAAVRLVVWFDLIGALALPWGIAGPDAGPAAWAVGLAAWLGRSLLLTILTAGMRTLIGVLRPRHMPVAMGVALLLGVLAVVLTLTSAVAA